MVPAFGACTSVDSVVNAPIEDIPQGELLPGAVDDGGAGSASAAVDEEQPDNPTLPPPTETPQSAVTQPAMITDSDGRNWDVTHARDIYGMNPEYYNYGLGVGAIPAADSPKINQPGDPEYPVADSQIRVFGVNHNGEQRAYKVADLTAHEVFNDEYPGESPEYLAVTY